MKQNSFFVLLGLGIVGYLLYSQTDVGDDVTAAIAGWKNVNDGPIWVPILNQTEITYGIPTDLLARVAYQESSFKDAVIRGTQASSAGALGILQMMPQYFSSVNVARPYSDAAVSTQISQAAQQLATLYTSTGSWQLALAAYNAGLGNVQKYGGIPPFTETQNYVADITADIPAIANA